MRTGQLAMEIAVVEKLVVYNALVHAGYCIIAKNVTDIWKVKIF